MIYLISGAPRCGKTILSKKITVSQRIPLLSTDSISPIIVKYIPKSQLKKKMPSEFSKGSEYISSRRSLEIDIIEARTMWSGIKALIKELDSSKQDYIIEGVHLLPKLVMQLKKEKYWKNIKSIYLIKKDPYKIIKGFCINKGDFDWVRRCLSDKHKIQNIAEMVKLKSLYFEKEAKKYKLKIINTERNFTSQLNLARKFLIKSK